jgi:glucose/galactose transporter
MASLHNASHSDRIKGKSNYIFSLAMLGLLFFIFGLVSWVNSILVPYFKIACQLQSELQSYLANFAFYIAYFVMAIPASLLLNRIGFKRGVMYGLWILAFGALLFAPAALERSYNMFLIALFVMGSGLAVLQTAANPFVTIIGPIESAARRISIMGICNKFAGIIAPYVFAVLVIKASDKLIMEQVSANILTGAAKEAALDELIRGVIAPYCALAILLFIFGIIFNRSSLPDINPNKDNAAAADTSTDRKSIFDYPYLILGAIALMFHVGSQVISINTIISYAESMNISMLDAKVFPSATLACILTGYLAGVVLIPRYLSQQKALIIATVTGLVLSLCVLLVPGEVTLMGFTTHTSIWFLVLLGIPNSVIYAGIWPLAIHDLGRFTNLGSSLLVMGLCGNALLPLLYGWVADMTGNLRTAYIVLIPCFLYMIFFALYGYRIEHWRKQA